MKRMRYYHELDEVNKPTNLLSVADSDLIVFCHLRWDFVFQRPQHLMSHFAQNRRVYFFEEPQYSKLDFSYLHVSERNDGLRVVVPYLPKNTKPESLNDELAVLVDELIEDECITQYTAWYYTPMALPFTRHLSPDVVIFDCMDELSAFKDAPAGIKELETELLNKADVVFTGGVSLFEAKKNLHDNVHAFPSSIDRQHFRQARTEFIELPDQLIIPEPRLGFFGVLDERLDIDLLRGIADLRPNWNFVMIGPVIKIDPKEPDSYWVESSNKVHLIDPKAEDTSKILTDKEKEKARKTQVKEKAA